jgi:hypothetical protein
MALSELLAHHYRGGAVRPAGLQAATMTEVADKRNAIKPLLASAQFLS